MFSISINSLFKFLLSQNGRYLTAESPRYAPGCGGKAARKKRKTVPIEGIHK
jgi:hypothetical protein